MLEDHVPLITCNEKPGINSTKPWYTEVIVKASIDRDLAKSSLRYKRTVANRKLYNALRNKVNQMISDAKDAYLKLRLCANVGMKTLWKNAKALGLATSSSTSPITAFTAHEFNVHSSGFVNDISHVIPPPVTVNADAQDSNLRFIDVD